MRIDVLTLFPKMFSGFFASIVKRAVDSGLVSINIRDLREFTSDKHRTADEPPFGGGRGMILKPEPVFFGIDAIREETGSIGHVILMCPQGKILDQPMARELTGYQHLIIICGHYEGVDERIREHLADREISIGNYILTGGELPAMVLMDAVVRLLPGVLDEEVITSESFESGLLDYPQYTRPREFRGYKVPEVLLSGNHAEIEKWRKRKALARTYKKRPDILKGIKLQPGEPEILESLDYERGN
ncbi:MAG: tRNA (guanosine(37)-N1)-methyltransferase TrmD [Candidatus Eremiobacteraeota bacterium]|nr:tRNA (guanosine(37)-N1)-methyltransferase TrmD [Candidatus Eremiobacteraeota bacterium]